MYKKQLESLTREEWRELVEFRDLFEFLDTLVPMEEGEEAEAKVEEEVKAEPGAGDKRPRYVCWGCGR